MKYTKPISFFLGIAFATAVTTLAAIGAVALAVDDVKLRPANSSDIAGWIQAVAAAIAIFAGAVLALHVQRRDLRERQKATIEIATSIALTAELVVRNTRDSLDSREKVYAVAEEQQYFDLSALDDIWELVSQFDLQSLHVPEFAKHMLIVRFAVRKVRQNVKSAITRYRAMDSDDYKGLFAVLKDESSNLQFVHSKLKSFVLH